MKILTIEVVADDPDWKPLFFFTPYLLYYDGIDWLLLYESATGEIVTRPATYFEMALWKRLSQREMHEQIPKRPHGC